MAKIILWTVLAVLVVGLLVCAFVPSIRGAIAGLFNRPAPSVDPTAPTVSTDSTQPTQPQETETPEVTFERPFTFEGFAQLATTDGGWHTAPEGATIFDFTADDFAVESEEEKNLSVDLNVRVDNNGAMAIVQEGFDLNEVLAGEPVVPRFELCKCQLNHADSWNDDFGQFHWNAAEGNLALSATSWSRNKGEMQEISLSFEEREIVRAVACYWFTENQNGEQVINYGIRVCGEKVDTKPEQSATSTPKPSNPGTKEQFTVSFTFSSKDGQALPDAVKQLLPSTQKVEEGTSVKAPSLSKTEVRVANGTWKFRGWDKGETTVSTDVKFVGTWKLVEDLTLAPPVVDPEPSVPSTPSTPSGPSHSDQPSAPSTPAPTVPAGSGNHPVADNQEELNQLGPREEAEEENTPQHTTTGGLSLSAPVVDEEDSPKPGLVLPPPVVDEEKSVSARTDTGKPTLSLTPVVEENEKNATESEVADEETQNKLDAMFGRRE